MEGLELQLSRARLYMYTALYLLLSREFESERGMLVEALSVLDMECIDGFQNLHTLEGVKARDYRADLDAVTRTLLPQVLKRWYESTGYTVEGEEPDTLKAMIAYIAKLVENEVKTLEGLHTQSPQELRKVQLRFLNTHIKPLIEALMKSGVADRKTLECLKKLVENDIEYLKEQLTKPESEQNQELLGSPDILR